MLLPVVCVAHVINRGRKYLVVAMLLVEIAVRDDATRRFSGAAQSALTRLGAAHGIQPLPYRSSYLMVGLKGLVPGHALEKHGMEAVELNLER